MFKSPLHALEHALHTGTQATLHAGDLVGNQLWQSLGYTHQRGHNPGALAMLLDPLVGASIRVAQGKPPTRAQAAQIAAMFPGGRGANRVGYLEREQEVALAKELRRQHPQTHKALVEHRAKNVKQGGITGVPEHTLLQDLLAAGVNLLLPPHGKTALGLPARGLVQPSFAKDIFPTNAPYWTNTGRIGQRTEPPFRGLPRPGESGLGMHNPGINLGVIELIRRGLIPSGYHPYLKN